MKPIFTLVLLTLVLQIGLSPGRVASAQQADWTPNPALLDKLSPETQAKGYSLRLPPGYFLKKISEGKLQIDAWSTSEDKNAKLGALAISTFHVEAQAPPLKPVITKYFNDVIRQYFPKVTQSPMESGTINGDDFIRVYWKATEKNKQKLKIHGFIYLGVMDSTCFVMACFDKEPANKQTLPLAEAAALTIRVDPDSGSAMWTADPKLLDQLSPDFPYQDFAIRPPKGYTYAAKTIPDTNNLVATWRGTPISGLTYPVLTLSILQFNASDPNKFRDSFLEGASESLHKKYTDVTITPIEPGIINGLPSKRLYFTGILTVSGHPVKLHGFIYATLVNSTLISTMVMVAEPDDTTLLPILDASALTLHKL